MGRKSLINSRNKVISVRITNNKFEQLKTFSPELKDQFNKLLRKAADGLIDKLIKINVDANDSSKINVDDNNSSPEINVDENNNTEINVDDNYDYSEINVDANNSHEMSEEEFNTFCAELDVIQDDRKINTESALKTRRSKLNKSFKDDSLHSRYMKDLEDKELTKVLLEDI